MDSSTSLPPPLPDSSEDVGSSESMRPPPPPLTDSSATSTSEDSPPPPPPLSSSSTFEDGGFEESSTGTGGESTTMNDPPPSTSYPPEPDNSSTPDSSDAGEGGGSGEPTATASPGSKGSEAMPSNTSDTESSLTSDIVGGFGNAGTLTTITTTGNTWDYVAHVSSTLPPAATGLAGSPSTSDPLTSIASSINHQGPGGSPTISVAPPAPTLSKSSEEERYAKAIAPPIVILAAVVALYFVLRHCYRSRRRKAIQSHEDEISNSQKPISEPHTSGTGATTTPFNSPEKNSKSSSAPQRSRAFFRNIQSPINFPKSPTSRKSKRPWTAHSGTASLVKNGQIPATVAEESETNAGFAPTPLHHSGHGHGEVESHALEDMKPHTPSQTADVDAKDVTRTDFATPSYAMPAQTPSRSSATSPAASSTAVPFYSTRHSIHSCTYPSTPHSTPEVRSPSAMSAPFPNATTTTTPTTPTTTTTRPYPPSAYDCTSWKTKNIYLGRDGNPFGDPAEANGTPKGKRSGSAGGQGRRSSDRARLAEAAAAMFGGSPATHTDANDEGEDGEAYNGKSFDEDATAALAFTQQSQPSDHKNEDNDEKKPTTPKPQEVTHPTSLPTSPRRGRISRNSTRSCGTGRPSESLSDLSISDVSTYADAPSESAKIEMEKQRASVCFVRPGSRQ